MCERCSPLSGSCVEKTSEIITNILEIFKNHDENDVVYAVSEILKKFYRNEIETKTKARKIL
jgi:hypothetical protein